MKKASWLSSIVLLTGSWLPLGANISDTKTYVTSHVNPHAPVIDGRFDEPVWDKVPWEGGFLQREPYEGIAPSQPTAFKILYDQKYVYVALRAYDGEPDRIERRKSRKDELDGDWVSLEFDSYLDQRTGFCFQVSAAGVKADLLRSNDGDNEDPNWDPIWSVKTAKDEQGWTAEMRIPLSQLRYGRKEEQVWGLQVTRMLFRKEEVSQWQLIPREAAGWVSRFGRLEGITGIKSQKQIEIYPYIVGNTQRFAAEPGNPFARGSSTGWVAGLDGKIGLTSNLTLDFTVNPDFGQVEADPSEVNLTAFETYFEEKRPFFIEGRNILSFRLMLGDGDLSSDNLFYSRRVGRAPQYAPELEAGEYASVPQNTSILGAFKLTGKTKSGLSIGFIDSVTSTERATLSFLGRERGVAVEPLTNYLGFRLQKDYKGGNTILGTMVTATNRSIRESNLQFLHSAAYTGGIDFEHWWGNRTYLLQANLVASHVRGTPEAILRTQQSPLHYFQRPDASHVRLDPERTSLTGLGGTVVAGKLGSGKLRYIGGVTFRSPGLELNDMGYLRDADQIMEFIWAGYYFRKPFSVFRTLSFNFNQWRGWDFSGEKRFEGGNFGIYGQFKNYYSYSVSINRNQESLAKSVLRGGPSLRMPGIWSPYLSLETDSRRRLRFQIATFIRFADQGGSRIKNIQGGVTFTPNSALSLSFLPTYALNLQDLQYVGTVETMGKDRFLFARLDQKTLALTLRLNLCLTPELSLQFYGQPFVSAGNYDEFKRITDSRAPGYADRFRSFGTEELTPIAGTGEYRVDDNGDGLGDYSFQNPNFNFLQFRSNLVLRWEYRPGSTLFLVWSQGRTASFESGDFMLGSDLRTLFDITPHNVFLIKFSYGFHK